ncbi:acyl carrier protein [Planctomycetota bacterium]
MADKLQEVFATVLNIDTESINDNSSPDNTENWDSLNMMNLVTAIEDEFNVSFSTREIMKMRTVGQVRETLRSKGVGGI